MADAEADCRQVVEHLYLFLDKELDGPDFAAIERHLEACAPCLEHVDFERGVMLIIEQKCAESLPEGLVERLRALLRERAEPS
jgi:mycothiol system anti-sigma-R factor